MSDHNRASKSIVDFEETMRSNFAATMRACDMAITAFENFRLAIPTDDVRAIRQEAAVAIDRVMQRDA